MIHELSDLERLDDAVKELRRLLNCKQSRHSAKSDFVDESAAGPSRFELKPGDTSWQEIPGRRATPAGFRRVVRRTAFGTFTITAKSFETEGAEALLTLIASLDFIVDLSRDWPKDAKGHHVVPAERRAAIAMLAGAIGLFKIAPRQATVMALLSAAVDAYLSHRTPESPSKETPEERARRKKFEFIDQRRANKEPWKSIAESWNRKRPRKQQQGRKQLATFYSRELRKRRS